MDQSAFQTTLGAGVEELNVDADALMAGVYRRHRRHQRRRLMGVGAAGLAAIGLVAGVVASDPPSGDSTNSAEQDVALTPYTVSATDDAPPLATVDGVELTYLPAELPAEPTVESGPYVGADGKPIPAGSAVQGCFGDSLCQSGMGVSVTRSEGLDLDAYLESNWIGDAADITETTVGGDRALASGVDSDEASRLVWSPRDGIVIEINIENSQAEALRRVVDGTRVP